MKRSEINKALRELESMCETYRFALPPFCHFTPAQWQNLGHEYDEVRECMLGWDITDYGKGDFDHFGFSLITIRNGNRNHCGPRRDGQGRHGHSQRERLHGQRDRQAGGGKEQYKRGHCP